MFHKLCLALDRKSVSLRLYDVLDKSNIFFKYSGAGPLINLDINIPSCLLRLCSRLSQSSSFLTSCMGSNVVPITLLLPETRKKRKERDRDRDRDRDRQTETDRHTDRQTDRQIDKQRQTETDRESVRERDRQTERDRDRFCKI